ncbi:hypothetical protein KCU65_g9535, partial [Aureobasidium melanogenum]
MSLPTLPPYKAVCESAEEAQRLAAEILRFSASLPSAAALVQCQGYIGQRALLEQNAGLTASNVALSARVAELEQQLHVARPAQPATTSGNGRDGHGGPAYGGIQKHRPRGQGRSKKYQGKPPGPRRDDGAGGAGASDVGA